MLKIIEAHDLIRIETIILTLYSPPGIGKTSLGFSADTPLLLDTDRGAHRSAFRKASVRPETWLDIEDITPADVKGYKTLVLDTTGRALDLLSQDIIRRNAKHGRGGALTLQGFGMLKSRFAAYLKLVRSFGLDIVLIAHSEEKQSGDDVRETLDMQGSSKQEVFKSSDSMARLGIVNGERVLTFSPTETQFGKDPAGIGRIEVPDLAKEPQFLAELMERIKISLNNQSDEMVAESKKRDDWAEKVAKVTTPGQYTKLVAKAWDSRSKRVLLNAAIEAGCEWDKKDKKFRGPEPEPEPESEPDLPEESESDKQSLPF